jgi:membrane associated rhomboid family serine protease
MLILPYRVKNPVSRFPVTTVILIAVNMIIYAFTTNHLLVIRESVARDYAFTVGSSTVFDFFASLFLHAHPVHILGNMLFLWVFGGPVEDRLGIARYLALYFIAGFVGSFSQAGLDYIFTGSVHPMIGASGCIMGIVGAYWYLYAWSTVCLIGAFGRGVFEIQAIWVIGAYVLMDVLEGLYAQLTSHGGHGVADFAHVGGGLVGVLLCIVMRLKPDTEAVSEAKAIQAEERDLSNIPLDALRTMLVSEPDNIEILRAMIAPSIRAGQFDSIHDAMARLGASLIDKDPELAAYCLLELHGDPSIYEPVQLLRLGGLLERAGNPKSALEVYQVVVEGDEDDAVECALYRLSLCSWNGFNDVASARSYLAELNRRFPHGEMQPFAGALLRRLP